MNTDPPEENEEILTSEEPETQNDDIPEENVDSELPSEEPEDELPDEELEFFEELQAKLNPQIFGFPEDYPIFSIFEENDYQMFTKLTLPEEFTMEDLRILTCMVYYENGLISGDVKVIFYDDEENPVYLPAHVMHQWTAQTCLNHLKDPRFADNIYDDVSLPRYTALYREESVAYDAIMKHPDVWLDCMYDVLLAMNGYVEMPENSIFESNFEHLGTHFASVFVDLKHFQSWSYFSIG
jgi:hypothetical protein